MTRFGSFIKAQTVLLVVGLFSLVVGLGLGHPSSPGGACGTSSSTEGACSGANAIAGGEFDGLVAIEAQLQLPPSPLGVGGSCEKALLGWNAPPVQSKLVSHRDLLSPLVEALANSDVDPVGGARLAVGQVVPLSDSVIPHWLSLFGNVSHSRYDPLDPAARARSPGYAIVTGISGQGISMALRVQFEVVIWASPPLYIMPSFVEGSLTASRKLDEVFDFSMSLPVAGRAFNVLVECGDSFASLGHAPHPRGGTVSPDGRRLSPFRLVVRPSPQLEAGEEEEGEMGEGEEAMGHGPDPGACISGSHEELKAGNGGQVHVVGEESRWEERGGGGDVGGVEGAWPEVHGFDDDHRRPEDYLRDSGGNEDGADDGTAAEEERGGNRLSGGFLLHPGRHCQNPRATP